MAASESSIRAQAGPVAAGWVWIEPVLVLSLVAAGGAVRSALLPTSLAHGVLLGSLFGLAFGLFFAQRATSPGAGLIWGVACALLLWVMIPAGILPMLAGSSRSMGMLRDARAQFPELVAYLLCLGMPMGLALGVRGGLRSRAGQLQFRMGRAVVASGLARPLRRLIFPPRYAPAGFFPPI